MRIIVSAAIMKDFHAAFANECKRLECSPTRCVRAWILAWHAVLPSRGFHVEAVLRSTVALIDMTPRTLRDVEREVQASGASAPTVDVERAVAAWRVGCERHASATVRRCGEVEIRIFDGSAERIALLRAAAARTQRVPLVALGLGDAAAAQALTQGWPPWWVWMPWPASLDWLTLAATQAIARCESDERAWRAGSDHGDDPVDVSAAKNLLGLALSASGLFDFEYDLETGARVPSARDHELIGYSPAGIDDVVAMLHPDDRDGVRDAFERSRRFGVGYHAEVRIARGDSGYRWIRSEASVIGRSPAHRGRLIGVSWDIHEEREAQQAAQLAKLRLEEALATAGMLSWDWSADTRRRCIVGDGLAAPRTSGTATLDDWIHPEDRNSDLERFHHALRLGVPYHSEVRVDIQGLGLRWLRITGYPKHDECGRLVSMSGLGLDVTERRAADEELADARALLLGSLNAGGMYCWEWNLVDGSRRTIGPSRALVGCSADNIDQVRALMHPDDRDEDELRLRRSIDGGYEYQNEFRIVRPDGTIAWLSSRGMPILGPEGRVVRLSGVAIDVTERRLAEETSREASHRLKIALDAAELNPWSVDLLSGVHSSGPRDLQLFGEPITSAEQFNALVVPEDRHLVARLGDEAFLRSGLPVRIEYRVQRADGSLRWLTCHAQALLNARGVPVQLVGISHDISEARLAQGTLARSLAQLERVQAATHVVLWEWNRVDGARCFLAGGHEFFARGLPPVHHADVRRVARRLLRCLRNNEVFDDEFRVETTAGIHGWVSVQGARSSVHPQKGTVLSGVMIDVSARRRSAEQLAIAQERLRGALEAAEMMCWDWKFDDGSADIAYWPSVTGGRAGSFAGTIDARDRAQHRQAISDALAGRTTDYRCEFRVHRPDGSMIWLLSIGSRRHEPGGRVVGLTGVAIDISKRKAVEGELEESRQWQQVAVEAGELGLWRADIPSGTRCGGELEHRLYGCVPTTIDQFERLVHPDDLTLVRDAWRRSVEQNAPYRIDHRIIVGSHVRWHRVRGKCLADPLTGRLQMVGATLDITDQKHFEEDLERALHEARTSSEAKSTFLATISHELRTPLNAVIGFAELLKPTRLDATQRTHLKAMSSGANQLFGLIHDLLDISRINAGEMVLEHIPFGLLDCLEPAIDMVAGIADVKHLSLAMTAVGDCHARVIGDPVRLRQVVVNLLANAVKFTESGSVQFEMEARRDKDTVLLTLQIADTGLGIPPQVCDTLYQPFRQGDGSTTRRYGGTGLGLSICKHLLDLMNGRIEVATAVGDGTRFTVSLCLPVDTAHPLPAAPADHRLAGRRVGVRVACAAQRRALLRQLETSGVLVHDAMAAPLTGESTEAFDAIVLCRTELDHTAVRWPQRGDGEPVPALVLVGIDQDLHPIRGAAGQMLLPLPRALKPRQLIDALHCVLAVQNQDTTSSAAVEFPSLAEGALQPQFAGLRVLVAEDIEVNRLLLSCQLQSLGIDAAMVADGLQVLDLLAGDVFDVILLDVEMPVMDGLEAAASIRRDPTFRLRPPYIVAVTAHVLSDSRASFAQSGFDDLISKPVSLDALRAALLRGAAQQRRISG